MSRAFVKEGDQEEIPIVPPRAFLPSGVPNYVTEEGMELLENERAELLAEIDRCVTVVGNEPDRRVERNYLNAKLALLEERIRSAVVFTADKQKAGEVSFGSYVTISVKDKSIADKVQTVRITGADEADAAKGLISYFSPMASAIMGKRIGEEVSLSLQSGERQIRIIDISSEGVTTKEGNQELHKSKSSPTISTNIQTSSRTTSSSDSCAAVPASVTIDKSVEEKGSSIIENSLEPASVQPSKDNANEIFPIVNERGVIVGRAPRWQCHNGSKLLHPVVHLFVFNSNGELYLQRRPMWKDIQPGMWDTSVGGHIGFGEKPEFALKREAEEELGISGFKPEFLKMYVFESSREKELVYVYKTIYDGEIRPTEELDGGKFWPKDDIIQNLGKKVFTPNFEQEFRKFFV